MSSVSTRDPEDAAKIKAIEKKLLANPDIAQLIDELGSTATDANDLVRVHVASLDHPRIGS